MGKGLVSAAMNKLDLIASVSEETGLGKAEATKAVEAVFAAICQALKNKQEVRVSGFGSFVVAGRKASTGRNPRTGAAIDLPASTTVRFKPGKGLKDAVNG